MSLDICGRDPTSYKDPHVSHVLHSDSSVSRVPARPPPWAAPQRHNAIDVSCRVSARACPHSAPRHVSQLLRGRMRPRDRIPTSQWHCPDPTSVAPACACSTSVNITPLQRPVVPPPGIPISREPVTRGAHARHRLRPGSHLVLHERLRASCPFLRVRLHHSRHDGGCCQPGT